ALSMHMPKASFVSRLPFRNWIRKFFNPERTAKRRKSETHRRRLSLEHLEDRLVPATVSEAAGVLTFNLNGGAGNEVLTLVTNAGDNSYTVTSSTGLTGAATAHWNGASLITPIDSGLVQIRVIDTAQTSASNTESVVFGTSTGNGYFFNSGAGSFVIDLTK